MTASYPLVTVTVVAHNPGAWFGDVLRSIASQDYPTLDVVVIDAASDDSVAPEVHEILPEATVLPLVLNQGFAKNANVILDHEALGPYLLICHDDVALAPDCIRRLVEETLRSNAGVVGPKLLDWNDPSRILHVGLGADKTGLVSDLAEPGEYDQEQHDAVRDVFAVPGAVTLLRTDLFKALGGFDEQMLVRGEDLDLCWRAHALGARVIVNPAATARHREDLGTRIVGRDYDRFARRHRIRSMLSNYGWLHTLRVVPQAIAASFVNIVVALFQGRVALIGEIVGCWLWNVRRLPSILQRRRDLKRIRQVDDTEVRAMQVPGFEVLAAWRRNRSDRREMQAADALVETSASRSERAQALQASVAVWSLAALVLVFGSRGLISDGLPLINEFTSFPDGPSSLLTEWGSTWRSTGVGADAPSSLLHMLLGFAGVALFGQMGLVRLLVTLGLVGVGVVGAYRLLTPFRAWQAQLVALVVYAASPLPYNALVGGSWSGLAAYAAMPWIAKRLAMAASIAPFADPDPTFARRSADTAVLALILALAALIEPTVVLAPLLIALGWLVGSLATRRVAGTGRLLLVALASMAGAFVLLMPASIGLVQRNAVWSTLVGAAPIEPGEYGLTSLARLAVGPHGGTWVGWLQLIVPALAIVMASGTRLAWAARSWVVAIGSLAIALAAQQGRFDAALPSPDVLLAPVALSLALAAAMTAVAFGSDLRRYRFGWRQLVPFIAVGALIASSGAGLASAVDGRWQVAEAGYADVFGFLDERAPAHDRALWIGDEGLLPVEAWRYDDELAFAITHAHTPTVLDATIGNPHPVVDQIRDDVEVSMAGASNRLGQTLAFYGIRYVIVVEANAPEPFSTIVKPVDPVLANRLTEQLDLVRLEVRAGATVYENQARVPIVSAFEPGALASGTPTMTSYQLALDEFAKASFRSYNGSVVPSDLYFAVPAESRWSLEVGGEIVSRQAYDWASTFVVDSAGPATLQHSNRPLYWIASLVQLAAWIALGAVLILARRRRS